MSCLVKSLKAILFHLSPKVNKRKKEKHLIYLFEIKIKGKSVFIWATWLSKLATFPNLKNN